VARLLPSAWLTLATLLGGVASMPYAQSPPVRAPRALIRAEGLASSTPEQQGMDSVRLAQAIEFLAAQRDRYYIHSLLLLRHGVRVADVSFWPFQPHEMHELSSASKPVMAVLMGIAIDKGYIAGVDERVLAFFPDRVIANRTAWKEAITIEHLLTMTSGLGGVLPYDEEVEAIESSEDPLQFCLDLPMTTEPGSVWRYANQNTSLLSAIITQATGMTARDFAQRHLMGPLGVTRWHWDTSQQGISEGSGGQLMAPEAFARIGQLMLQGGWWRGEQLLSSAWVEVSTALHVAEAYYCYIWGRYPDLDVYWAGGSQGQRMVVSEALDLVAVFTGGGYAHGDIESIYKEALQAYVFPAVVSEEALDPNPAGVARLEAAVRQAATGSGEPVPPGPLPPIAAVISGRTYDMEVPAGALAVTLRFPSDDEARLSVEATPEIIDGAPFEWAAGLDGVVRFGRGQYGVLAAGTGRWAAAETFVMDVDTLGRMDYVRLTFVFAGEGLTLTVEDTYYWRPDPPMVLNGHAR